MIEQVQNPIHFKVTEGNKIEAFIKASETFTICCGRNIAFISELPDSSRTAGNELRALTWIDPVTTEMVNPLPNAAATTSRRLMDDNTNHGESTKSVHTNFERRNGEHVVETFPVEENIRRFLKSSSKKSHIHGTNGYMVPLHSTSELLGIAHFHRPEGRDQSHYARHGHHYSK